MIQSPAAFRAALKTGQFVRSSYMFLMSEGQTHAAADYRWTDGTAAPPPTFSGISFSRIDSVIGEAMAKGQSLAGRDISSLRLADPDTHFRRYFEANGFRDFAGEAERKSVRWELWLDYAYGADGHFTLLVSKGEVRAMSYGEDDGGRYVELKIGGQFAQMDPDYSFTLTAEQQRARRDPNDTCLDELNQAWSVKLGRPI